MKHGLIELGSRGVRFQPDFAALTYVALLPPSSAPTANIGLRLFNALPSTSNNFLTVDNTGQLGFSTAARLQEIESLFSGASAGQSIRKNSAGTALEYYTPSTGGGGSALNTPVRLTITGTNTLSALPTAPTATGNIILYVDGIAEFAVGTNPSFTVSGTTISWNAGNAGYTLDPAINSKVFAVVW